MVEGALRNRDPTRSSSAVIVDDHRHALVQVDEPGHPGSVDGIQRTEQNINAHIPAEARDKRFARLRLPAIPLDVVHWCHLPTPPAHLTTWLPAEALEMRHGPTGVGWFGYSARGRPHSRAHRVPRY